VHTDGAATRGPDVGPALAAAGGQRLDRRRFPWQAYAFLSPALIATTIVFAASMVILLVYSFRAFTDGRMLPAFSTVTWTDLLTSSFFWHVVWTTMKLGLITVALTIVIGYPMALALYRLPSRTLRYVAYFLLFAPLLTSVVVRSYGWALILGDGGFVNDLLMRWGVIDRPIRMLYEFSGVTIGLVHILLPFMVFPILAVLDQVDPMLEQAAADLGATGATSFRRVLFPLTVQGVIAGAQLVFALAISAFATPTLLGGGRVQVLAEKIYNDVGGLDWPHAGVASYVLLTLALAAIAVFSALLRLQSGTTKANWEYAG